MVTINVIMLLKVVLSVMALILLGYGIYAVKLLTVSLRSIGNILRDVEVLSGSVSGVATISADCLSEYIKTASPKSKGTIGLITALVATILEHKSQGK